MQAYLDLTVGLRTSGQLFVCNGTQVQGPPLSAQRIAHWICDANDRSDEAMARTPPMGPRLHSTGGVVASTSLFRDVSVNDICLAASWFSTSTFVQSYLRDTTAGSVSHSVPGTPSEGECRVEAVLSRSVAGTCPRDP